MPIVPTKDRSLNMPCDDPEGCKHFKAEMKLQERIAELEADYTDLREIQATDYDHAVRNADRIKELEAENKKLIEGQQAKIKAGS